MKEIITLRMLLNNRQPNGSKQTTKSSKTNTHLTPKSK
jgi:hypothetical protein